ncbi:hypothetical protein Acy02nite_45420 [Actinoplanes cyaneus]|uniref:Uncharacterized protein n=1 Tax=Actinoplanes cyaneus TaxID=52696 RepID=A0A919IKA7_9ACTN|nr:hypothetical protein Acy02nite_45420 [Actinoplanes cyaneus]
MLALSLVVLSLIVPGLLAVAASPAWAAAYYGGSVPDGMRWSLFLGTGIAVLLLVIVGEMWWLARQDARASAESDAS